MRLLLIILLSLPVTVLAQGKSLKMTPTVETAFGSVAASYAEKLSFRSYRELDIVNKCDCDIQIRLDDISGTPDSVIPAGSSETISFGRNDGGYVRTSVSLQYMSGETCSSGSVYMKGIY